MGPRHTDCKPLTAWLHVHFNALVAGRCCVISDYKATRTTKPHPRLSPVRGSPIQRDTKSRISNRLCRIFRRRVSWRKRKVSPSYYIAISMQIVLSSVHAHCTNLSPQFLRQNERREWSERGKNKEKKIDTGRR